MSLLRIFPFVFAVLLSAQAFAQASPSAGEENSHYGWADVLRVDPVYGDDDANPPPPCYEEQVPVAAPSDAPAQNKRGVFTAIGAFVGGILGNQFGKGNGRAAATVAGAVAGGVAGNNIAAADEESGDSRPQYKTVRHCPQAAASRRKVVAYDVEYRYRGDVYSSRLDFDPGDRLRVKVNVTPSE